MRVTNRMVNSVEIQQPVSETGVGAHELLLREGFAAPPAPADNLPNTGWLMARTFSEEVDEIYGGGGDKRLQVIFDPDDYTAAAAALAAPALVQDQNIIFACVRLEDDPGNPGNAGAATQLHIITPYNKRGGFVGGQIPYIIKGTAPNGAWVRCPLPIVTRSIVVEAVGNPVDVSFTDPSHAQFSAFVTVAAAGNRKFADQLTGPTEAWLRGSGGASTITLEVTAG